jgi:hypothetical protein
LANTQVQIGFQPWGITGGKSPNFADRRRTIAFNYGTALYRGDPVVSNAAGNIILIASQSAPFAGCHYYDPISDPISQFWCSHTLASVSTHVSKTYG